jgi:hypothetical protein
MTEDTITLNGKEYAIESLSDKAKYMIDHIQKLREEGAELRNKLDVVEVAAQGFTQLLSEEIEPEEK